MLAKAFEIAINTNEVFVHTARHKSASPITPI
jgi:hypothetical protein